MLFAGFCKLSLMLKSAYIYYSYQVIDLCLFCVYQLLSSACFGIFRQLTKPIINQCLPNCKSCSEILIKAAFYPAVIQLAASVCAPSVYSFKIRMRCQYILSPASGLIEHLTHIPVKRLGLTFFQQPLSVWRIAYKHTISF